MRRLLFALLVTFLCTSVRAQNLNEFDASGEMITYLEVLEEHMNATGNSRAKNAFANFVGIFTGGGFDESRQRIIAFTTVELAKKRINVGEGMSDYLDLLTQMTGAPEMANEPFDQFHDAFTKYLTLPEARTNPILAVLQRTNTFLQQRRFEPSKDATGWLVIGGSTGFEFDEGVILRIDTVQQLLAVGRKDTLRIDETQLFVNLAEGRATGKGGRTDWQRQGLDESVFALLVDYSFDTRRMLYTADSAHLQYPQYFEDAILVGTFSDKVQPGGAREGAEYPKFISSDGFVEFTNVGEGIDLFGNFELRGGIVYSIGEKGRKARVTLTIEIDGENKTIKGRGRTFAIKKGEAIGGQGVETTIYVGNDSLYHPSVTLRVDIPGREVDLTRSASGADRSPFFLSLNNLNIYADHINVYLDGDSAVVGKPTLIALEKDVVAFESKEYFSEREYDFIRDIARANPLDIIYAYRMGPEGGNDVIPARNIAGMFGAGFKSADIQPLLYDLQTRGFLLYDQESDEVTLLDKLAHYVRARREEIDYDKLRIVSDTKKENAVLDLRTGEIRIDAVQPIEFNRVKQVAIKPLGDQLVVKNNRDFEFSGDIYAGGMFMTGKSFNFKYDPYHIELDSVRFLDLFLPVDDFIGEGMKRESTGSRIEHVSGYLLVDAPKNKSGTEDLAYFPSLQSKGKSYIYYDRGDTSAIYARDSFYFELEPFSLNGMDSLLAGQVEFDGELVSGGIFPNMKESLTIQEDGSLGFITQTKEGGQTTYGERGSYDGEVVLSNRGLEGKGKLTYLEANIDSEDLKFTPERTTASARSFDLEESVTGDRVVPQVVGTEVNIDFIPYGDSLVVNSVEDAPFELFKAGEHRFDGGLVLTPEALKGNGTLGWSAADLSSKDMDFTTFGAYADTANVFIRGLSGDDRLALSTSNVKAEVDFTSQRGSFENNSEELATALPYNQFKTSIDHFDWDMAGGNVTFQAEPGKNRFTSTHPDQDELTFTGDSATFDINTSMLEVKGVPYVKAADAKIFPGDGYLRIEPGAKITELTDARIVADTLNEYHVINRATVQLIGRKEYRASGFYEYNVGPHTQEFELQNILGIRVGKGKKDEKNTATRAEGKIEEGTTFYVDNKTKFFGTINLDAREKTLLLEGFAKIDAEHFPGAQWFTVRSEGDRKNLTLRVEKPKDRDGLPLFTGFYLSKPYRQIYPSMVQTLDFRKDHAILDANGIFNYDEGADIFRFGDSVRVFNPSSLEGNLMEFDHAKKELRGSGKLGLGGRIKYVKLKTYGTIAMDMPSDAVRPVEPEPEPIPEPEEKKDEAPPSMFILEEETEEDDPAVAVDTAGVLLTIDGPVVAEYPEVKLSAMAAVDLILPDRLINMMATDLISGAYGAPGLNVVTGKEFYQAGLKALFPASKELTLAEQSLAAGVFNVDKKINTHTLLFSKLNMKWSSDYQSFVTTEKLSGLASIKGNPIAKMLEVHMEVKMPARGDDRMYIYIKSPSELYYFFGFNDGILNVVSNNTQFMNTLENMKAKDMILKMNDGQTYEILPVSPGTAQTFLRRVKTAFGKE